MSRLRAMDAEELRFRVGCEARKAAGQLRARIAPPRWRRSDLLPALAPIDPQQSPLLGEARRALQDGNAQAAHVALARHFSERGTHFPLDPRTLPDVTRRVLARFAGAADASGRRAERVLAGQYDLLGYERLAFGAPPRWHWDPVHGRGAPLEYWAAIDYLDPRMGDHKIVWELNRHQHWLWLARAHHLTGDARYYAALVQQLENWMAANPPLRGINWASMLELGLRCISWTWALHFFARTAAADAGGAPWIVDLLIGVERQLQHIERNLSRYFSPNTHLLGEALALYVVGRALPELRKSEHRVSLGRRILLDELHRQVNRDGGHAELSAHYHRYTTDFYVLALLSARATGDAAAAPFELGLRKLAAYLRTIADDRGRLPLLGDDDGGQLFPICGRPAADCTDTLAAAAALLDEPALLVSEVTEEVFWLCGTVLPLDDVVWRPSAWPSAALPDSGYYVSRTAEGDHLIVDAGRHGFLNGGHAHADALSVVLAVGGHPLLVDSGTATYTMDSDLRNRFRSTVMHNTVVVNGRQQSEPTGPFHWRTSTDASAVVWQSDPAYDYVEGWHPGYAPIIHWRSVLALHGFGWIIIDHLLGEGTSTTDALWHVHPEWEPVVDEGHLTLRHPTGPIAAIASSVLLELLDPLSADGIDAYAPVYGSIRRGTCISGRSNGALPRSFATFVTRQTDVKADLRRLTVAAVPLSDPPPPGWHAAAFKLSAPHREMLVLACVERAPAATVGAPRVMWGASARRTDGRFAVAHLSGPDAAPVLIKASRFESRLASSVHG